MFPYIKIAFYLYILNKLQPITSKIITLFYLLKWSKLFKFQVPEKKWWSWRGNSVIFWYITSRDLWSKREKFVFFQQHWVTDQWRVIFNLELFSQITMRFLIYENDYITWSNAYKKEAEINMENLSTFKLFGGVTPVLLKGYSWLFVHSGILFCWRSSNHMGYRGSSPGWLHAKKTPYPLNLKKLGETVGEICLIKVNIIKEWS